MNQSEINPNRITSEQYYPLLKIISLALAFVAAFFMLYYATDVSKSLNEELNALNAQIQELKLYESQGVEIPAEYKAQYNLPIAYNVTIYSNFIFAILPLIGALLPNKYSKVSILLISAPILFCFKDIFTTAAVIIMKADIKLVKPILFHQIAGLILIASAVLLSIKKKEVVIYEEEEYESPFGYSYIPEDLEDEDYSNFAPLEASDESGEVEIEITVEEEIEDDIEEDIQE